MKKIINKIFLFGLFSFLFFINTVNAETSSHTVSFVYDTEYYQDIVLTNQEKINNLIDYINLVQSFPSGSGFTLNINNNNVLVKITNLDSSIWRVYLSIPYEFYNYYNVNNSNARKFIGYPDALIYYDVSFDSNNSINSFNRMGTGGSIFEYLYGSESPINNDITLTLSDGYYITDFLSDSFTFKFIESRGAFQSVNGINIPIKLNDSDLIYQPNSNVPVKLLFDSLIPNVVEPLNCSKNQVLGFLSNVSDFTFRIKGESNALSEPIRGQLQFNYPNDLTITDSDINVELIQYSENVVDGSFKLNCPSDIKACYIEYSYNYIDDITSEVDFGFKVSFDTNVMPRYIQLYNCFHNDTYDYFNTSYTYTNNSSSSSNNDSIISNFLQDGSQPDIDGLVDTSLIGDGPVDSILLLPLNIMNTLLNVLNTNTCQPLVLPLPFVNRNLTLPCISTIYSQINGLDTFLNWFSAIISAFILYEYFIRLYKWVDDTLTFRENNHFGGF